MFFSPLPPRLPAIVRPAFPQLGQFTSPLSPVTAGGVTYQIQGNGTFSPVTVNGQLFYNLSGQVRLVPAGPVPVPTPVPPPTPTPTPTPLPVPTPTPVPLPGHVLNVKGYGAVGDDATDDTAACQRAVSAAQSGDTVYFPTGVYKLSDQLKANHKSGVTFAGDGPTSTLHNVAGMGFYLGTGGEPGAGLVVTRLRFLGNAGATMRSTGLPSGGIQIYGPTGTLVDNCDFESVTSAVYDAAPTSGTVVKNCRVFGWARIAFFLEKNGSITNTKMIQTDPHPEQENTSHGVYIHGGASNTTVADCEISGVAKYALQVYSEAAGTATVNVHLLRLNIHDCRNGIIFAHSQVGAGEIHDSSIEGCTIANIPGGSGIAIKDGTNVQVTGNHVTNSVSAGIYLGVWAPYEAQFSLAGVSVSGNTVAGCGIGIWTLPSNGGSFSGCTIGGNSVTGNRKDYDITGAGISFTPGGSLGVRDRQAPPMSTAMPMLNLGDTITIGGLAYQIGATLVPAGVTPAPIPIPIPTPTPTPTPTPLPVPGPLGTAIWGFRDGQRNWTARFHPGETIYLEGVGFGAAAGQVKDGGVSVPLQGWSDTEIRITCPAAAVAETPALGLVLANGAVYQSGLQFTIQP